MSDQPSSRQRTITNILLAWICVLLSVGFLSQGVFGIDGYLFMFTAVGGILGSIIGVFLLG